jgi:hypothetical protein
MTRYKRKKKSVHSPHENTRLELVAGVIAAGRSYIYRTRNDNLKQRIIIIIIITKFETFVQVSKS